VTSLKLHYVFVTGKQTFQEGPVTVQLVAYF